MTTIGNMTNLADQDDLVNIVYYGDPGSGKTTSAASLAKLGPIVVIEAEAGLKRRPLLDHGVPVNNIRIHRDITFKGISQLSEELRTMAFDKDPNMPVGVIWDSVSESQKLLLMGTVDTAFQKARNSGKVREPLFIDRADWGVNTEEMRRLIRPLRDLPLHVGFVALSRRDQDDDGSVSYSPAMTPAIGGDLMGYCDLICHQHTIQVGDEVEYWGHFRTAGKYIAKDRYNALPAKLIDPTFDRVIAYVKGDLDAGIDERMAAARKRRQEIKTAAAA